MKPDLSIAYNKFDIACIQKLNKKEKEGWVGWDDLNFKADLMQKLWAHCVSYVGKYNNEKEDREKNKDDLVDISMLSMFLWNLENKSGD